MGGISLQKFMGAVLYGASTHTVNSYVAITQTYKTSKLDTNLI